MILDTVLDIFGYSLISFGYGDILDTVLDIFGYFWIRCLEFWIFLDTAILDFGYRAQCMEIHSTWITRLQNRLSDYEANVYAKTSNSFGEHNSFGVLKKTCNAFGLCV